MPFQVLDRAGYLQYEPALAEVQHKFVGALRLPDDETGDCFKFTQRLAEAAKALGVQFRFGVGIEGIDSAGGRISGVRTAQWGARRPTATCWRWAATRRRCWRR